MNRKASIRIASLIAALAAVVMLVSGCAEKEAVTEVSEEDAAKAVVVSYFDAFNAQDARAIADLICSEPMLTGMQANDMDYDQFVSYMESNISYTVEQYGENYRINYDEAEFSCEDAAEQLDGLNEMFGLTDAEVKVDTITVVSCAVSITGSDGIESEPEEGSVIVYRYDGEWYLYG